MGPRRCSRLEAGASPGACCTAARSRALIHSASPVERLLKPRSVAVIGDAAEGTPARALLENLLAGGFGGPVLPVCPGPGSVAGVLAYPDIASLPVVPDLALVSLPEEQAGGALAALAARGAGGAVVTGALPHDVPQRFGFFGAASFGLVAPSLKLNASFAPRLPRAGGCALVCHDGGIARAVLDHAGAAAFGFSHVVSLGRNDGLGFAAVLDWLSRDSATRVVLIEVARIKDRRRFLSAARAVSRGRAVIALRTAPEVPPSPDAEFALGAGAVFSAALRRAGIVDVGSLEEMLDAAAVLSRRPRMRGERVFIAASAPSLAALAGRAVTQVGGIVAAPGEAEAKALGLLAAEAPCPNPAIAAEDAPATRLGELAACAAGLKGLADAVLAISAPGPSEAASNVAAEAVVAAQAASPTTPLVGAWAGGAAAEAGRARLAAAGIPAFSTIEGAARAVGVLIRERRTRLAAGELPPSTIIGIAPDRESVRRLFARARRAERGGEDGRVTLTEDEAATVLNAYGIPTAPSRVAADAESAGEAAAALGFPVVLKIRSPDIPHKTTLGGVVLELDNKAAVRAAALAMEARIDRLAPGARREGFLVQRQIARAGQHELLLQLGRDALFGPAIAFGQGGTAARIIDDVAAELPPLNLTLAAALVSRTRVARLLAGFRDSARADLDAVHETLVRLSQLAVDFPGIATCDINPLVAGPAGVMALDAWITIDRVPATGTAHLAIAPYPAELARRVTLADGREVTLRPIRPEDADAHAAAFARLDPEDVRYRFFAPLRALSPEQIARMTQIDYDREMAFIATREGEHGAETLGVVRIIRDGEEGEFAIVVRSDAKGAGLGSRLMRTALDWARSVGIRRVAGDVLAENRAMLRFVERLGFALSRSAEDPEVMVASISLDAEAPG